MKENFLLLSLRLLILKSMSTTPGNDQGDLHPIEQKGDWGKIQTAWAACSKETQKDVMQATKYQERVWKWERAGWTFMGVVLLSGLVEILAPAPLNEAVAHTVGIRFGDSGTKEKGLASRLEVQVGPEATGGEELILQVASKHFRNLEVQNIVPPPAKVITTGDTFEYVFPVQKPNEGLTIRFYLRSRHAGQNQSEMHFSTPGALAFSRFLAP